MTVIQHTFRDKQLIEQHIETEYTEQLAHNIKNT